MMACSGTNAQRPSCAEPAVGAAAGDRRAGAAAGASEFDDLRRSRPLEGRRILVVEDDFLIGFELAQFIESLGAAVLGPFATTAAARAAVDAASVDGALLDVGLGRETSLGLAHELAGRKVPVIFVTAYAEEVGLFAGPLARMPRIGKPVARAVLKRRAAELFA